MKLPWWYEAIVGGVILLVFAVLELTVHQVDQYVGVAALAVATSLFARGYLKRGDQSGNGNGNGKGGVTP